MGVSQQNQSRVARGIPKGRADVRTPYEIPVRSQPFFADTTSEDFEHRVAHTVSCVVQSFLPACLPACLVPWIPTRSQHYKHNTVDQHSTNRNHRLGRQDIYTLLPPSFPVHFMRFSAFSLFMLSPLLSLTARRTARRCFLTQAFQQSVGGVTHQHRNLEELFSKSRSTTLRTFASSSSSTTVEDDLDAALDNLLDDALYEAENPIQQGKNHIQGSRPMPPTLVEKVRTRMCCWGGWSAGWLGCGGKSHSSA